MKFFHEPELALSNLIPRSLCFYANPNPKFDKLSGDEGRH